MIDIISFPFSPTHYGDRAGAKPFGIVAHALGYKRIEENLYELIKAGLSAHYFIPQITMKEIKEYAVNEISKNEKSDDPARFEYYKKVLQTFIDFKPQFPDSVPAIQLVDCENRAWHAGVSRWANWNKQHNQCAESKPGVKKCDLGINCVTIGVEFHSPGYNGEYKFGNFTEKQTDSGIKLFKNLIEQFKMNPMHVVAHSDITPSRKTDPTSNFPWGIFAQAEIGYLPTPAQSISIPVFDTDCGEIKWVQQRLVAIGYEKSFDFGTLCKNTQLAINAYRMHYLQEESEFIQKPVITDVLLRSLSGFDESIYWLKSKK